MEAYQEDSTNVDGTVALKSFKLGFCALLRAQCSGSFYFMDGYS